MGTIIPYTKKDKKTYYKIKFYIGTDPLTGKPKESTKRGFKSSSDAKNALARIELSIREGTYQKPRVETYQDVYNLWIDHYKRTVEPSTFAKTRGLFNNHILPAMGSYKIDKIEIKHCQQHVDEWADKLKNFRSVKYYAAKVLNYAIKYGYIKTNPFALVEMNNKPKKICLDDEDEFENFYTKEQLLEFLSCMKQEPNFKVYALFNLLAYTGMRKGEALALTWKDIDFKNNMIRINKAISRDEDNNLYLKSTKTGDSRTIEMYPETVTVLKEWKKQQREDLLALGLNTSQPKQLVFSNENNEFIQPTKTRKWLERVLTKYQLPKITTHGFRHTHCSLMFEAGVGLKEVQDRLGHSDVKTTMNIYAHVSKHAKDEAINKFIQFMKM